MKKISIALAVVTLVSMASATQAATILATAPARASYPNSQTIYCDAVNAGTKPVTLTFEAVQYDGTVDASNVDVVMAPGTGDGIPGGAESAWCRFTVTKGSAKSIRAMAVYDDAGTYVMSVPAR
jgi:hypothetical protein